MSKSIHAKCFVFNNVQVHLIDKDLIFQIIIIDTVSYAISVLLKIKMFLNVFQVVLKGDNSTQLVQDDQVKGPLRVCILHAFSFCNHTIDL